MADLSQLSDEELLALEQAVSAQDLSGLPDRAFAAISDFARGDLRDSPADTTPSPAQAALGALPGVVGTAARRALPVPRPEDVPAIERGAQETVEAAQRPGVLPAAGALGFGLATGGMGAIPAAGMVGLGAGAGEAGRQLLTGGPGGMEAARSIGEQALIGAMADLGVGIPLRIIKGIAPTVLQVFEKIPGEALKRMVVRWRDMSPGLRKAAGNQAAVDRFGIKSLGDVQDSVEMARRQAGKQVDDALKGFQKVTKGGKVINTTPVADALENVLAARQAGDEAIAAAVPQSELRRLNKIAAAIRKDPMKTATQAVELRRSIDDLTKFKKGAVTPVTSGVGQQATREMGMALRESIQASADDFGYTALSEANENFHRVATVFDDSSEIFATRSRSQTQMLKKMDAVSRQYYAGGLNREILEGMASTIPGGRVAVNNLIDAAAVRAFERPPQGTPSGAVLNVIRLLGAPRFIGAALRNAETIGAATKVPGPAVIATQARREEP